MHPVGELSLNFTHYRSTTLEKNLRTQRENTDFGVRKAANNAIVREINDQALHIWLYDTPWAIVAQKRVRGLNDFRTAPVRQLRLQALVRRRLAPDLTTPGRRASARLGRCRTA